MSILKPVLLLLLLVFFLVALFCGWIPIAFASLVSGFLFLSCFLLDLKRFKEKKENKSGFSLFLFIAQPVAAIACFYNFWIMLHQ